MGEASEGAVEALSDDQARAWPAQSKGGGVGRGAKPPSEVDMAGMRVKRGDTVAVIAGKERGKRGKVLRVLPGQGRLIVEKLNMIKRHQRPTQKLRQGGIIEREGTIPLSNVMVVCTKCDRSTRIAVQVLADGRKVRVCKRCREIIDKV